jgi:hypothetical protein
MPRTDTDRLDFLLRFLTCEDIGDDDVSLALTVDAERLRDALPVDIAASHVNGSMLNGWTCDARQVIDAAIKREVTR